MSFVMVLVVIQGLDQLSDPLALYTECLSIWVRKWFYLLTVSILGGLSSWSMYSMMLACIAFLQDTLSWMVLGFLSLFLDYFFDKSSI